MRRFESYRPSQRKKNIIKSQMSSSLIYSLREAYISYSKKEIFTDLTFNLQRGELIALVGKNGVGKSTLMNVISGKQDIDQGEVWSPEGLQLSYFNQDFHFINEDQTIENELSKLFKDENEYYKIDIFCENLFLDKTKNIKTLSGGQKRRVGLIKSLIVDSDILLLDEPTNHLDLESIVWLENYLKNYNGAILCVSHDRQFLNNFTNKVFWLDRGNLKVSPKGFNNFDQWSADLLDQEARELRNRKQFVNIETEWASRGVKARVKRNIKRVQRAKELKQQLENDVSSYKRAIAKIKTKAITASDNEAKSIIEFYNTFLSYKSPSAKIILKDFTFKIAKNDRIGVLGNNGTGKSSFLKILVGELEVDKGTVKVKKDLEFSYFDQMRNDLKDEFPIKKILVPNGGDYIKVYGKERHVCSYLKDFMFDPSKVNETVGTLSGGQKNKLLLSKVLANPKTGLILDEPTNDLDIETLDLLEEMLVQYKGTLLIVSHDRDFLDQTVNKILFFEGDGEVTFFNGGYSDFLQYQTILEEEKKLNNTIVNNNTSKLKRDSNGKNKKKLTYKLEYELEKIPSNIDQLHIDIKDIEEQLSKPDLYKLDKDLFIDLTKNLQDYNAKLESSEERWVELMSMKSEE
ncbi:MAG: ABC-F family ATP-binding cassette domain-containing protein [Alphaproteobacteria bacterium]|jgi:ATP-binding cassette subfamily F protein uup|tara:strand:- start:11612 stop:13504 length:1893 start_codon:yes stop_codon:yes gene_type:complete